jgi:hypothetical protein
MGADMVLRKQGNFMPANGKIQSEESRGIAGNGKQEGCL